MQTLENKSLSLQYHPQEDRMKLIINKEDDARVDFWITRRFYLSILFKLDTFGENLGMTDIPSSLLSKEEKEKLFQTSPLVPSKVDETVYLLDNIKIRIGEKKKRIFISFYSKEKAWQTIMPVKRFLIFYTMMKNSFPKKEWGFI